MPEHLKALVVILVLATVVFAFAKTPACALASTAGDFERRRNLWFGITLAAFLAHNFWIFIIVAAALLLFALPREPNKLAMFFFLLFAVPMLSAEITGLGIINYFFTIDFVRLLTLAVLLPAFLYLRKQPDVEGFGRLLPDKLIAGYIVLSFLLMLSASTFTNTLRYGAFYAFIDIFLPYYVASRSLKNLTAFRDALMAFVVAALILAAIGPFEFARHWLLYASLENALGVNSDIGQYLLRGEGGGLRALASTGHSIVLGYVMAVAAGFFPYLRRSVPNTVAWGLGLIALMVGLIAPLSRGPWVGAAAMLLVFVATGPFPVKGFAKLGLLGLIIIPLLLVSPAGQDIIDYLPFVGTFDFMYSPSMQEMKQGQGIIDIVNTYLGVGLSSGLVGLALYSGFFIAIAVGIIKGMRKLEEKYDERYLLGRTLLSVLLGIMIIIFTVSSISVIPVIYWSVAGLGVAYARMLALGKAPAKEPEASRHASFQPTNIKSR